MKKRNRYDDDNGGSFTSTVKTGTGGAVTSGSGKAVMSRSFRSAPETSPKPPMRPKATSRAEGAMSESSGGRVRFEKKAAPRAQEGGRIRHKAQASSTGGPSRYESPMMQTGPRTRPNNAPKATATAKSTKRVPGRAIALALRNAFTGQGPTDPAKIVRKSRKKNYR